MEETMTDADTTVRDVINALSGKSKEEIVASHLSRPKKDMLMVKIEYSSKNERVRAKKTIDTLFKIFKTNSNKSPSASKVIKNDIRSEVIKDRGMMSVSVNEVYSSFWEEENLGVIKDTIYYKLYG
jgi:hypothetical protein